MNTAYERCSDYRDEWLTPPWIIELLGPFDLDPCAPVRRPWSTAAVHYTIEDNGLWREWQGLVWLNPPYSNLLPFLRRMVEHDNGIALLYARTDTEWFHKYVFDRARELFFLKGRLRFYDVEGREAKNSAGAPSVLVAYGEEACERLARLSNEKGKHVYLR
jgi:phage N-6-adenine-methyltransferase